MQRVGCQIRTGACIGTLTDAGLDPKVAQAHGKALESALFDDDVTKDYLDRRLAQLSSQIRVAMYQALFVQSVTLIGLTAAMIKLLK
jgi:hypothetical protein